MKSKLYIFFFTFLCSFVGMLAEAQVTRTWTGLGDGQSWNDGYNWNPVTCKYQDGDGNIFYQEGHIPPRTGEIAIFDNVGTLNLINTPSIVTGYADYKDYTDIVNNCSFGAGALYALKIVNSTINMPETRLFFSGNGTPMSGYSVGLLLQNSTITCWDFIGEYANSGPLHPLTMNAIYAENSTITCTYWQSGFYTGGRTYFTHCIINCHSFSPYSNNDYPDEKDEFVDCTINAGVVYFGGKCTAIATNCIFNVGGIFGNVNWNPEFNLNWSDTINSVTLNNVQINADSLTTSSLIIAYQPGTSVINGNINCNSIWIHNPSNTNNFPLTLNGNLRMRKGSMEIRGALDITGNLEMSGLPDSNYTKEVLVNNDTVFQIGGVLNYMSYGSNFYGPIPGGQRFGLKFSGSGDSHIKWPIGFPIDTLTIEKTGCGKVYIDNAPLHVTGNLLVNSGQLVLAPRAAGNYSLVDGGDMIIKNGGSIFVQPGTDIAIAGSFIDENTTNNPATCSGFSNSVTDTVAFYNTIYSPANRVIGSANSTIVGNVAFINQDTSPFTLQNNFKVANCNLGTHGKVILGNYDFIVDGILSNCDSTRYFATSGTGRLQLKCVGSLSTLFPVGISDSSYTPVYIVNNGTLDDFKVRVQKGLFSEGISGTILTGKAVNRTWFIDEGTSGGSDVNLTLQWNASDELSGFNRNETYLFHYTDNNWDLGSAVTGTGSEPYQVSRNNITSFSPFGIGNIDTFLPVTAIDPKTTISKEEFAKIFPNPIQDIMNLQLSDMVDKKMTYRIINSTGKVIKSGAITVDPGSQTLPVNIKNLPSGVYYLTLKGEKSNTNLKFVKD